MSKVIEKIEMVVDGTTISRIMHELERDESNTWFTEGELCETDLFHALCSAGVIPVELDWYWCG